MSVDANPRKKPFIHLLEGHPERTAGACDRGAVRRRFYTRCLRCGLAVSFPIDLLSRRMMEADIEGGDMVTSCPRCCRFAVEMRDRERARWKP